MASLNLRLAENVPGELYVDETCIDCDTCRELAPETFGSLRNGQSFVRKQPQGDADWRRALMAVVSCPTASIGAERRAAGEASRRPGRGAPHVPHPPGRRSGPRALPRAVRLRPRHPSRRRPHRGGDPAGRRARARARRARDPRAGPHPRKLRAARRRSLSFHRRPPLGRRRRPPGHEPQRLLVLVERAEGVASQIARLSIRMGAARPWPQPAPAGGNDAVRDRKPLRPAPLAPKTKTQPKRERERSSLRAARAATITPPPSP